MKAGNPRSLPRIQQRAHLGLTENPVPRRRLSTFLAALLTAVMVRIRDSTGLAPPPHIFTTEEVHWLSPELENEFDGMITIEEPAEPDEVSHQPPEASASRRGPLRAVRRLFARMMRGRG